LNGMAEAVTDPALATMTHSGHAGVPEDQLSAYRGKRDRDKTPEPVPEQGPLPRGNDDTFVIREHQARRLHWDFRLERGGVLVPWALPKGVPEDPAATLAACPSTTVRPAGSRVTFSTGWWPS
jgi:hypothetical protein